MRKAWSQLGPGGRPADEVKKPEQILKARRVKEKLQLRNGPKELRERAHQAHRRKQAPMKTKLKKGGKRRR